jgi:hypothetical protein
VNENHDFVNENHDFVNENHDFVDEKGIIQYGLVKGRDAINRRLYKVALVYGKTG